jgi:hypothetical protein
LSSKVLSLISIAPRQNNNTSDAAEPSGIIGPYSNKSNPIPSLQFATGIRGNVMDIHEHPKRIPSHARAERSPTVLAAEPGNDRLAQLRRSSMPIMWPNPLIVRQR